MNPILQLKGSFNQRANPSRPGSPALPPKASINIHHINQLKKQLQDIHDYWIRNSEIQGALVSVHYKNIVAKSNRLCILLSYPGHTATDSIRGAKFAWETNQKGENVQKHIFTHYVPLAAIEKAIRYLEVTASIVRSDYGESINSDDTNKLNPATFSHRDIIAVSSFIKVLRDCWYVERFDIDRVTEVFQGEQLVTIYQTDVDTKQLLAKFGLHIVDDRILDNNTLRLRPEEINLLVQKAGYLISMSVTDLNQLTRDDIMQNDIPLESSEPSLIPRPKGEPVVGVIDTLFDNRVYFHEWVDYHQMIDESIPLQPADYYHGTAVTSIIVDGPRGNPELEDHCGRFRVQHFGVATQGPSSSFTLLRKIRSIVANNRDIKVWNLSLGSP